MHTEGVETARVLCIPRAATGWLALPALATIETDSSERWEFRRPRSGGGQQARRTRWRIRL